jgi:hypothetical protein
VEGIGKDGVGNGRDLFKDAITAFVWMDCQKPLIKIVITDGSRGKIPNGYPL